MTATTDAVDRLRTSMNQAGLLFQTHPDVGAWEATRPGAFHAEVAAFTNKTADPGFARVGVRFYDAGETDPNGYTFDRPAWIVETLDEATIENDDVTRFAWEEEQYGDRDAMLERVVEIMETVTDEREASDE